MADSRQAPEAHASILGKLQGAKLGLISTSASSEPRLVPNELLTVFTYVLITTRQAKRVVRKLVASCTAKLDRYLIHGE